MIILSSKVLYVHPFIQPSIRHSYFFLKTTQYCILNVVFIYSFVSSFVYPFSHIYNHPFIHTPSTKNHNTQYYNFTCINEISPNPTARKKHNPRGVPDWEHVLHLPPASLIYFLFCTSHLYYILITHASHFKYNINFY